MNLTEEKLAIVKHVAGPALVVAGPGVGKTAAIVYRAAELYRIVRHPGRVLCVTFSVDAAAEMRRRIAHLTGYSEKTLKDSVSTFHSIAFRILREEGIVESLARPNGDGAVLSRFEQDKILREFVQRADLPRVRNFIASMRRHLAQPEKVIGAFDEIDYDLCEAYSRYDAALRAARVTDFDSMVYFAVTHLWQNEPARQKWQSRFAFVMIDEAHDVSPDQIALAKLLAEPEGNLLAVLDPSQSIYGFRGADFSSLMENIANRKVFYLTENYRSGREIIDAFLPFAETDALSAELSRRTRSMRNTAIVTVNRFADEYAEAAAVTQEICGCNLLPETCAVLARTRAELLPYCETLQNASVPYNWRGVSFWQERDIVRALAYCEYCLDPAKGFPPKLPPFLRSRLVMLADVAKYATVADLLRSMRAEMNIGFSFDDDRADDFAQENFDALIRRAELHAASLAEFLAGCRAAAQAAKSTIGVTLSTIHAAKGLEWRNVFAIGLSRDKMPHPKSENANEERRLVYVALSRAKDSLWVSYAGEPSVFVDVLEKRKVAA